MKEKEGYLSRLTADLELPGELLPGESLVELAGDRRVFIENHRGILEYSHCRIVAAVRWGRIQVCGNCLELARMTKENLVIVGKIESVSLLRRDSP